VSWFPVRAAGPVAVLAIGIALVAWTTFRLRGVRARAYRRWLAEEQDAAEPDEP
jgi:hypothetical protein